MGRASRENRRGYVEKHHVIPRCLGGTDDPDNLVRLTAREHFLAHQLLVKIHPGVRGLSWALVLMCGKIKYAKGRHYEWARKAAAKDVSRDRKGVAQKMTEGRLRQYEARKGKPLSPEHRAKMSAANKGKILSEETKKKLSDAAKKRPPPSPETLEKLRVRMLGNSISKGVRQKPHVTQELSKRMKGKTFRLGTKVTDETKKKISLWLTGRTPSLETRARISASNRVLSDDQIRGVKRDYRETSLTQKQIGAKYGLSQPEVSRIVRGVRHASII